MKKTANDLLGTHTGNFLVGIPSGEDGTVYPIEALTISPMGSMISVTGKHLHVLTEEIWFLDSEAVGSVVHLDPSKETPPPVRSVVPSTPESRTSVENRPKRSTPPRKFPTSSKHEKLAQELTGLKTKAEWDKFKQEAREENQAQKTRRRVDASKEAADILAKMELGVRYTKGELCPEHLTSSQWYTVRDLLKEDGSILQHGSRRSAKYSKTTPTPGSPEVHSTDHFPSHEGVESRETEVPS